jgi:Uma2 family endonuclease
MAATTLTKESMDETSIEETRTAVRKRLITVDEYYKMADAGIFHEDDPIELIEGELIETSPVNTPHINCVMNLTEMFTAMFEGKARVSIQSPVYLGKYSEPEPDAAVLKKRNYGKIKPAASDVLLMVEVADSTLLYDRREKLPLYAKHGVPEFWIVNIAEKRLEVYREPQKKFYKQTLLLTVQDEISPLHFSEVRFAVSDFFRDE